MLIKKLFLFFVKVKQLKIKAQNIFRLSVQHFFLLELKFFVVLEELLVVAIDFFLNFLSFICVFNDTQQQLHLIEHELDLRGCIVPRLPYFSLGSLTFGADGVLGIFSRVIVFLVSYFFDYPLGVTPF